MTKAECIFNDTMAKAMDVIEHQPDKAKYFAFDGWSYGKTPIDRQFMSQRTLNSIKRLAERQETRLGDSTHGPNKIKRRALEAVKEMIAMQQSEFDREREERRDLKHMNFNNFMKKHYPEYC